MLSMVFVLAGIPLILLSVIIQVSVCYVCVCIHARVGVCSCHMNLTFMVNYTCRYFRDATLNIDLQMPF